jgi:carboxymethylenebutenolidase
MKNVINAAVVSLILFTLAITVQAQDWAKARIDKSPRHMEWVDVKHGSRTVNCFVAYPEVKDKAPVVIVIHEIFGMTDWVRSVTDKLAEAGYIAIAPDLLSGMGPKGGGSSEFSGGDVRKAIGALPPDQITADLDATAKYAAHLPSANGKIVVGGFCWGGGQSFRYATHNKDLKAAFVFYGSPPEDSDALAKIGCPVYGFYGENDNRITSTVEKTKTKMKEAAKTYEPVIYSKAGHGFMREGEDPQSSNQANKKAHDDAWKRWKELLAKM